MEVRRREVREGEKKAADVTDIIVQPTGIRLLCLAARFIVGKTYSLFFFSDIRKRVPLRLDRPTKLRKTAISRLHWEKILAAMINRPEMHGNEKTMQSCLNDGIARDLQVAACTHAYNITRTRYRTPHRIMENVTYVCKMDLNGY